ncbi:MAG: hypothetical protein HY741_28440 [Chloroflexi bacterium]|nr:hypothetical protein [Chloroflexota bacterium]
MKSGLLWYDASANDITAKIMQAATRYQQKFGVKPDTCFVNPHDVPQVEKVQGIQIKSKATIMPNHLWLGITE